MLTPVIKEQATPSAPHLFLSFLTTPFLSPSPNLLTHSPSLLLFFFSANTQLFSSHSIPHMSRPSTTLSLSLFSLLSLVDLHTLSAHVWCPPSDQLQLGRAGESDINNIGQERDSRPLPSQTCTDTFQEAKQ